MCSEQQQQYCLKLVNLCNIVLNCSVFWNSYRYILTSFILASQHQCLGHYLLVHYLFQLCISSMVDKFASASVANGWNWYSSFNKYSSCKAQRRIPKLMIIAHEKNVCSSKSIILQSFYCLEWSILLHGYLLYYWFDYIHIITLLSQCVNELIHLFITYLIMLFFSIR